MYKRGENNENYVQGHQNNKTQELLCDKEEDDDIDDECYEFQDEDSNFEQLLFYSRD
jgi:hypothetical protein